MIIERVDFLKEQFSQVPKEFFLWIEGGTLVVFLSILFLGYMILANGWERFRWLLRMVGKSLRQHLLSTCVTMFSVALAAGLVMSVFSIKHQTVKAFTGGPIGYDAVLGARGSQLQLVLNTVYHLETSPGNVSWTDYQKIKRHPMVDLAIPYALGDNYLGYRVVGTTDELFTKFEYQEGKKFEFADGGAFIPTHRTAVIGSYVAQKTGLRVGDTFQPYHGLYYTEGENPHPEVYEVKGVLEATNTPNDRVIWIPIEGIFRMTGHALRDEKNRAYRERDNEGNFKKVTAAKKRKIPDKYKEVSAVMIKFVDPSAGVMLSEAINKNKNLKVTMAFPIAKSMIELFNKIGWVNQILAIIAYLVVLVAAASILASIYNTMNERRREFAILRSLGAQKKTVMSAIILEAGSIAFWGGILGYLMYAITLTGTAYVIRAQTGVVMDVFFFHPVLVVAPLGMGLLGAVAGIIPAYKAYSTDVATNLVPTT